VADSSVLVANSLNRSMASRKDLSTGSFNVSIADYNDIYIVKVRRTNSVPRGLLTFALVGASLGAIIGAMVYEPPSGYGMSFSQAECAGIGAVAGTICSIPVGVLVGSIKIKIPINGNINTFNQNRNKLKKYSYMH
jgi:ethanolamine transporter EutH